MPTTAIGTTLSSLAKFRFGSGGFGGGAGPVSWPRSRRGRRLVARGVTRYTKKYRVCRVALGAETGGLAGFSRFPLQKKRGVLPDAHYRDGYPNSEFVFDGFAWLPDPDPWWSYPGSALALRGKLAASLACDRGDAEHLLERCKE